MSKGRFDLRDLPVAESLTGHGSYVDSLIKLAACLRLLAASPGEAIGISAQRIRNMLVALVWHAANDCSACSDTAGEDGLQRQETSVINAFAVYLGSDHDRSSSSLQKICFDPDPDAGNEPDEEIVLLPELLRLFETKRMNASQQAAPQEATA